MSNYLQKFIFIFLSLCLSSAMYAMENGNLSSIIQELVNYSEAAKNNKLWLAGLNTLYENYVLEQHLNQLPDNLKKNKKKEHELILSVNLKNIQNLLDEGANPNVPFKKESLLEFIINNCSAKFSKQTFEYLLEHGAGIDTIYENGLALLHNATVSGKNDWIKILIQHNADINKPSKYDHTPLTIAILHRLPLKILKILCKAGASPFAADSFGQKASHFLSYYASPRHIITFMKYANFDSYPEIISQNQKEKIKEILLVLYLWNIPGELVLDILSKLPPKYHQNANGELCQAMLRRGYKHPYICAKTNSHITYLKKAMDAQNTKGKTALDNARLWKNEYALERWKYIDSENGILASHTDIFNQEFPHILESKKFNITREIYNRYAKELEKQLVKENKKLVKTRRLNNLMIREEEKKKRVLEELNNI